MADNIFETAEQLQKLEKKLKLQLKEVRRKRDMNKYLEKVNLVRRMSHDNRESDERALQGGLEDHVFSNVTE